MRRSTHVLAAAVAVVSVTALVLVSVLVINPNDPPKPPRPKPTVEYVAMGSSFASGIGDGQILDARCGRTADSYPNRVADRANLKLTDVSCAGAMTRELIEPDPQDPGQPIQIDAVSEKTEIVTVTIGGNDVQYVPRTGIASCANILSGQIPGPEGPQRCTELKWPSPFPTSDRYAAAEQSMTEVLRAVKARAPKATILLVGYVPVASTSAPRCGALPLEEWQIAETAQVGVQLDEASRRAADAAGVEYLSMSADGASHTVCAELPWIRGYGQRVPFHPNSSGNLAVAERVMKTLGLEEVLP